MKIELKMIVADTLVFMARHPVDLPFYLSHRDEIQPKATG
jgi:hypothetical protein